MPRPRSRNFTALKGRGARFTAGGVEVIDESYNANPASMAAALALLGQGAKAAASRSWATCWKWVRTAAPIMRALRAAIEAARADLVFPAARR